MTGWIACCLLLAAPAAPSHASWTPLLSRYVHSGEVDYHGLKANSAELDGYLRTLVRTRGEELDKLSRADRLAFWINAYNAYTVRTVLDHYPLKSIRSIGLLPGAAFRASFIPLAGEELSLNDIEDRLRSMKEPRIHFALVCAAKSCPALRAEAYTGEQLERQLSEAAREFLADRRKNRFDPASRTLELSSIFKWYRGDFESAAGSVEAYVARYAPDALAQAARQINARIAFLEYDWSLNGK